MEMDLTPTEKISSNFLPIESYSKKLDQAISFIKKRKRGECPSLKTSTKKLNEKMFDGFEWNRIVTIAGLSGTGKSIMLSQLRRDFIKLNPKQDFEVLSFELEMLGQDQASRDISSNVLLNAQTLYSTDNNELKDSDLLRVTAAAQELKKYDIKVVDELGNVEQIIGTILNFAHTAKLVERKAGIVVTLDHTLLIKPAPKDFSEKDTIDKFYKALVALKKHFEVIGINCIFIILSQLNRDLESKERIMNPLLHYPTKNDLFASSATFYCSDYVIITHKPAVIEGIVGYYGPANGEKYPYGLPVKNPDNPKQAMIYWHVIKARFSSTGIIPMLDDFENSRILQYE